MGSGQADTAANQQRLAQGQTRDGTRTAGRTAPVSPQIGGVPTFAYAVPTVTCGHCKTASTDALTALPTVRAVGVDLGAQRIMVTSENLDDQALRRDIRETG